MKKFLTSLLLFAVIVCSSFAFVGCAKKNGKMYQYDRMEVTIIKAVYDGKVAATETMELRKYVLDNLGLSEEDEITPEMQEIILDMEKEYAFGLSNLTVELGKKDGKATIKTEPSELSGDYYETILKFNYTQNKDGILDIGVVLDTDEFTTIRHINGSLTKTELVIKLWDEDDVYFNDGEVGDVICRTIYLAKA